MASPDPAVVASLLNDIEADLKSLGFWSKQEMDPAIIESSRAAFGSDVMPFAAWLQFVLLPRARSILESDGDWPDSSMVAAQAVREFDGQDVSNLIDHLSRFDSLFNGPLDETDFQG